MDDILSAALGQSGLNFSFLEDQQVTPSAATSANGLQSRSNHINTTNIPAVPSNILKEDTEDVTELLNLLDDTNTSKDGIKANNKNDEVDMLDFLLKYQSDDDETASSSAPSPVAIISTPLTESYQNKVNLPSLATSTFPNNTIDSRKLISISSKFPKITTQKSALLKNVANSNAKNSTSGLNIISRLTSQTKTPVTVTSNSSNTVLAKHIIIKGKTSKPTIESKSTVFANTTIKTKVTKVLSEEEKKKLSIQHVLASPNLTYREKQFLMKKALSANIKPSHPSMSTTLKEMTALKRSSSVNIVNVNNEFEDEEEDHEQLVHTDTFADYMPMKVKVGYGHPDPVVETSSMASVAPPDVWYSLMLPREIIDERKLSALQLESIVYTSQQHEKLFPNGKRAGFLIGDGAGVGKGRTVAGIIFENYLRGRKRAIWLSVSNDLRFDAMRDLRDIGCHAKVMALNKAFVVQEKIARINELPCQFKYDEKITSKANGKFKKGCIFSTYSALIGETTGKARFKSRLEQLLHWCGEDYDGVIILDECHKAKNLMPVGSSKPTKTGITVLKLQDRLPRARVVYCSATGASEPKNMAYMNRLGLWGSGTAFKDFGEFLQSIEKRGVGAMEMVAMDMKLRGMYIARQLSFSGVTFDVKEVKLCPSFIEMYDAAVKLWLDAREKFEKAAEMVGLDGKGKKTMWGQFWSAHQRFFKYLCIAAKVKTAVDIAKQSLATGKCVLFGLQSTGEARTLDQLDDMNGELNDFISTTKGVFSTLVEKHFPNCNSNSNIQDSQQTIEERKRKREWRKKIGKSSKRKRIEDGVEFMSSDDTSDSDEENYDSEKESDKDNTIATASDKDSDEEEDSDTQDERDPFAESSDSDEDDEDSWLRAASEKPKPKKAVKIAKLKLTRLQGSPKPDPSANALAAAGLNLGRQYSWANLTVNNPVSTDHIKGNRQNKTIAPQGLSERMLNTGHLKRSMSTMTAIERCRLMKESLTDQLEILSPYLPPNTLDELIDELGGPENVAEMTGRKGRVVAKPDGSYVYEPRAKDDVPLEVLNVAEKKRFMNAEKLIAVISEAASSGISLQADRREKNQRRRVHITLELPWSADKAIQQFGRSHRSNQVSAPQYLFLISELAGEQRFASIVAKRLESLGALTHGDRRATESRDLSRYNFDTKYGRQALDVVLKSVVGHEKPIVPLPTLKNSKNLSFLEAVKESLIGIGLISKDPRSGLFTIADKDYTNISRFLNRILGLTVELQNSLFQYFTETLATIIKDAKRSGRFDEGILDLGAQGESVTKTATRVFNCPSSSGQVTTELHTVSVERGLSFEKASQMASQCQDENEGFYISAQLRNGKNTAVLVLRHSARKDWYNICRPNIGLTPKPETIQEIQKKYKKATSLDAEPLWNDQYEYSENNCSHAYWRGFCKRKIVGLTCEVGTRKRTCHILCGSVLSVWTKIETLLSVQPGPYSKMQIIRARLDSGQKIVGLITPGNCVDALVRIFAADEITPHQMNINTL